MKNIWAIFVDDLSHLKNNAVALVVVIGLAVIPCVYAWFNIAGSWDPYSNTQDLKIAVSNDDAGMTNKMLPVEVCIGDTIVAALHEDDNFDWVFTTTDEAKRGVEAGTYYAALVIPETFSDDMMSFLNDASENPVITYYVNQKANPIASIVTGKGADAVQQAIDTSFNTTVAQAGLTLALDVVEYLAGDNAKLYAQLLSSSTESAALSVDQVGIQLKTSAALMNLVSDNLDSIAAVLSAMQTAEANQAAATISSLAVTFASAGTEFSNAATDVEQSANSLYTVSDELMSLSNGTEIEQAQSIIGSNPQAFAEILSAPVQLERNAIYPIANNGSAMASFYSVLSIWVGSTILCAMMRTNISPETRKRIEDKCGRKLRSSEEFLGRFLLFWALSLAQTTLICIGDLYFLGITCAHPVLFVLSGWVISLAFCALIYTLASLFGDIGKALCVILLVLQVSCSGGTFPIEMIYSAFQFVYPYLPFTHGIDAMLACVGGIYGFELLEDLAFMAAAVAVALLFGLVFRKPIVKGSEFFEGKLHETKLM